MHIVLCTSTMPVSFQDGFRSCGSYSPVVAPYCLCMPIFPSPFLFSFATHAPLIIAWSLPLLFHLIQSQYVRFAPEEKIMGFQMCFQIKAAPAARTAMQPNIDRASFTDAAPVKIGVAGLVDDGAMVGAM